MKYSDLPIFEGITPEIEAYLDAFDFQMEQNHINISDDEMYFRKISLYYDYLEDFDSYSQAPTKEAGQKFITSVISRAEKMSSHADNSPLLLVAKGVYGVRRTAHNIPNMTASEYSHMLEASKTANPGLHAFENPRVGGWLFKETPSYQLSKKIKPVHRYILNVNIQKDLLQKLDEFAVKYNCQYKYPLSLDGAYKRPDSIIIYTADTRVNEQQQELYSIIKPYVREHGDHLLDGQKITDGLFTAPEKTTNDVRNLANEAVNTCPRLQNLLKSELRQKADKAYPLSLGEFSVYQKISDSALEFKKRRRIRLKMIKGITLTEPDKSIFVHLTKKNELDFTVKNAKGIATSHFVINRKTGVYVAKDLQKGKIFSNSARLKAQGVTELPKEIVERFKLRARQAAHLAEHNHSVQTPVKDDKTY